MSLVHISNLMDIREWIVPDDAEYDDGAWETMDRFQNARPEIEVNYEGNQYPYLSFIYQGATMNRTGDNLEAALVVSTNQISMNYAYNIVTFDYNENQRHIKKQIVMRTCLMNENFNAVERVLNEEFWVGASMNYDDTIVEVTLASSIDAIAFNLPNQVLNQTNVGYLPTTANIRTT